MNNQKIKSITVPEEVIGTRTKHGFYEEYEMTEDLIRKSDGQYILKREFCGYPGEVNAVRSEFIKNHAEVEISPEEAERWLDRKNAPKATVSAEDLYPSGITGMYFTYSGEAPATYDGSWFRSLLEETDHNAFRIDIAVGCSVYNERGRYWEDMSDVITVESILVQCGTSTDEIYEEIVTVLKNYRKNHIFKEHTAFTERITVIGDDCTEIGFAESSELPAIYNKMAETIEDFDVLGW